MVRGANCVSSRLTAHVDIVILEPSSGGAKMPAIWEGKKYRLAESAKFEEFLNALGKV